MIAARSLFSYGFTRMDLFALYSRASLIGSDYYHSKPEPESGPQGYYLVLLISWPARKTTSRIFARPGTISGIASGPGFKQVVITTL